MENKEEKGGNGLIILGILVVLGVIGIILYETAAFTVRTAHDIANGAWAWILVVVVPVLLIMLFGWGKGKKN